MDYLLSILAGIIQGLAEFLPISSSGHLVIFHEIFKFDFVNDLAFDVALHLGTFLALVLFFYRDLEKIIRGFFSSLTNWNLSNNYNQRLAWLIILGTIPAVIAGYFGEDLIERYFRSPISVALMLIAVGLLFFVFEKKALKTGDLQTLSKTDSVIIGLAQALALIPGVSRSGITIIAGLGRKLKREEAARFSFLLSIPVVFGAGVKEVFNFGGLGLNDLVIVILGGLSATIVGYLAIKYLLKYLANHSLNIFAWYRLTIGCLILILSAIFGGV